jgi:cobalt-zinc-cadmium resistance protein CzcA
VADLKTLQDWVLQRRFRAVPGVVDVTGWGGKTRQYDVEIDLDKLVASKLTLPQVIQTLSSSNSNVGGNTIDIGPLSAVVRGVGLIRSIDDLNNTYQDRQHQGERCTGTGRDGRQPPESGAD